MANGDGYYGQFQTPAYLRDPLRGQSQQAPSRGDDAFTGESLIWRRLIFRGAIRRIDRRGLPIYRVKAGSSPCQPSS
jgi:hypothetical protein